MDAKDYKPVIKVLEDSDLTLSITYPACYEHLKENQVVVTVEGSKERYLVTVEKYQGISK